jgi:hypothetical protein
MKRLLLVSACLLVLPCAAFAGSLPDTGQTRCYDEDSEISCPAPGQDFYGQDAQYSCNPRSYTDLGNGIVRDNVTGLEWQQDTAPDTYRWQEAIDYCGNLMLGDHDDWRLPTIQELSTLVDSGIPDPGPTVTIDYFPDTVGSAYSDYWSSTGAADIPTAAWIVHFSDGSVKGSNKMNALNARAVRGTLSFPALVDNGDGTVTDTRTGLIWEVKTDDGGFRDKDNTYTWEEALAYCEGLTLAEHDDWRLPNRNELQSIMDYNRYGPSVDPSFPLVRPSANWSSDTNAANPDSAWTVNFYNGAVSSLGKENASYLHAVRGGQCRIVPTTTTTLPSTTTTPDRPCAVRRIYGDNSEATELVRSVRDGVLSRTAEGQEIIKLYYLWSPVIVQAMEEDEELQQWLKETIDRVLPMLASEAIP